MGVEVVAWVGPGVRGGGTEWGQISGWGSVMGGAGQCWGRGVGEGCGRGPGRMVGINVEVRAGVGRG